MTQNVTLSVPKEILIEAKIIAIKQGQSLSGMMTRMLAELVEEESRYGEAMARSVRAMENAKPLNGNYTWSREELHER